VSDVEGASEHSAENDAPTGRPQGGMKSEAGRAAYWRMNYEAAIGALADLIAENTENVEVLDDLRAIAVEWREDFDKANTARTRENETHANGYALGLERYLRPLEAVLTRVTPPGTGAALPNDREGGA
jgi:hypothetical protein